MQNKNAEMENNAIAELLSLSAKKEDVPWRNNELPMSVFPYLTQIELWSKFKNVNLSKSLIERKPLISNCNHIFLSWT